MNKYQLAKLVELAGTLESRKRMQKLVFMLQASGCPLGAEYFLHRYGPYSQEVARLTTEMVNAGLLDETEDNNGMGGRVYGYQLTTSGTEQLRQTEKKLSGKRLKQELSPYRELAKRLLKENLWELEVASTIVYYKRRGQDWKSAKQNAFRFKEVDPTSSVAVKAEDLARLVVR